MTGLAAKLLTVSDSASTGSRHDCTGPALDELLRNEGFSVIDQAVVPDDQDEIVAALSSMASGFCGLVVTSGGTGFGPRDVTPEATTRVLEREAPGLAEAMRSADRRGALSRGRAGIAGRCMILNVPGSPKGATEHLRAVLDLLPHALELLGGAHPH